MRKLEQSIQNCSRCSLQNNRTNIVFGSGNAHTKILFIGEAPGKNEDEQGNPFVGKAGQYLNKLLDIAGLKRDDVYITNVVKCRPPSNRNPKTEEIKVCSVYLEEQIKKIDPEIIVTLGNFASKFVLDKKIAITQIHGQVFEKRGMKVLPVFHPASVIYDSKKKQDLEKDFKFLKTLL